MCLNERWQKIKKFNDNEGSLCYISNTQYIKIIHDVDLFVVVRVVVMSKTNPREI